MENKQKQQPDATDDTVSKLERAILTNSISDQALEALSASLQRVSAANLAAQLTPVEQFRQRFQLRFSELWSLKKGHFVYCDKHPYKVVKTGRSYRKVKLWLVSLINHSSTIYGPCVSVHSIEQFTPIHNAATNEYIVPWEANEPMKTHTAAVPSN